MSATRDPDGRALLNEAIRVRESARLLVSPERVRTALDNMAEAVTRDLAHENPLVLAVMNGGAFTTVELCQRWGFPYEVDFIHATRYGKDLEGGDLTWRAWPEVDLDGRTVLVVDDIVDHGETLLAVSERLRQCGAAQVHSAILVIKRLERRIATVDVDYAGFEVEDVYVFGCGMDYKGYWRGLTGIWAVNSREDAGS